jgi:hypothetical protein
MSLLHIFLVKILCVVVTESACKELGALLTFFHAGALVVLAALFHDFVFLQLSFLLFLLFFFFRL